MNTKTNIRHRFEDLSIGNIFNILDSEEKKEFNKLLDSATKKELQYLETLKKLKPFVEYTIKEVPPSPAVKQKILSAIHTQKRIKTFANNSKQQPVHPIDKVVGYLGLHRPRVALGVVASFAILSIACLSFIFSSGSMFSQQSKIQELTTKVEQQQKLLNVFGSTEIDFVIMNGEGETSTHYGKVIWNPVEMQAVLQVRNLPKTPEGKNYQLWLQQDDEPISAGVFNIGENSGDAFFHIEKLAERYQARNATFTLTLENEGGAEQPTGPRFLIGKDI